MTLTLAPAGSFECSLRFDVAPYSGRRWVATHATTLVRPARSRWSGRGRCWIGARSTALPVETAEQARQITTWYSYRWLIERLHYVLKSGCKLEDSQVSQEVRLERLLAVYTLVAWRVLWLTYQARITPDAPCTVALQPSEWQALYLFIHKQRRLPKQPPSLHQAVRWIAQLGGFLGRKGDGEPGVKVLWRGWSRLQDITATFTLLQPPQDVGRGVGGEV